METRIFPKLDEPIRYSPVLEGSLKALVESVKVQGLEGLVAKRRDSRYEPGLRSGAWQKDAGQPRTGVRDRRLHDRWKDV
jgi:bifunctional non-homologous end joining protein LigD